MEIIQTEVIDTENMNPTLIEAELRICKKVEDILMRFMLTS
jgi:hypothetical protein